MGSPHGKHRYTRRFRYKIHRGGRQIHYFIKKEKFFFPKRGSRGRSPLVQKTNTYLSLHDNISHNSSPLGPWVKKLTHSCPSKTTYPITATLFEEHALSVFPFFSTKPKSHIPTIGGDTPLRQAHGQRNLCLVLQYFSLPPWASSSS